MSDRLLDAAEIVVEDDELTPTTSRAPTAAELLAQGTGWAHAVAPARPRPDPHGVRRRLPRTRRHVLPRRQARRRRQGRGLPRPGRAVHVPRRPRASDM